MQSHNDTKKSRFNGKRTCYLTDDGRYYCYTFWDEEAKQNVTQRLEVGKDISVEWTMFLDESDREMDLNERHRNDHCCALFEDTLGTQDIDCYEANEPTDSCRAEVRRVIDEDCTEAQQNLFFSHFGEGAQLEELRQAEAERTGKLVSSQAMTNRKNKLIDKVAKALGVERVKRHRYPAKG